MIVIRAKSVETSSQLAGNMKAASYLNPASESIKILNVITINVTVRLFVFLFSFVISYISFRFPMRNARSKK
jgi:hypothetical protein